MSWACRLAPYCSCQRDYSRAAVQYWGNDLGIAVDVGGLLFIAVFVYSHLQSRSSRSEEASITEA